MSERSRKGEEKILDKEAQEKDKEQNMKMARDYLRKVREQGKEKL